MIGRYTSLSAARARRRQLQPVNVGEHEVQQHQIDLAGLDASRRGFPAGGMLHCIAGLPQQIA